MKPALLFSLLTLCAAAATGQQLPSTGVDMLILGNAASEQSHQFQPGYSEVLTGLLGEPARRLLPLQPVSWEGGKISFTMKVDANAQNYLTARFSGDEVNENYLILFCEGKQVGYRHLGDIDVLELPDEQPRYNGRFYYVTTPLPAAMTRGKTAVHLEIRSTGPIWGYGGTWDKYQKPMMKASSGIYCLYTHTNGCFIPPADEKQGAEPTATRRDAPGPEVMDQLKQKVNGLLDGFLASKTPLNQMQIQFVAKAYSIPWTHAYQSQKALDQVVACVDALYRRYKANPDDVWNDRATWNPGWFSVGPAGDAVRRVAGPLKASLDQPLDGAKTRRAAWFELFHAGCDHLRANRRWLSNQALFSDVNIYRCNRAALALDPANAMPEDAALHYLYQGIGLEPWLGSDTASGPAKPLGNSFYQVTDKGLTRERGYVGGYGEVGLEGAMDAYDATRGPDGEGNPRIKAQLAKMIDVRAPFRYPMLDAEGHTAMRLETAIGWRDTHLPGDVVYAERPSGEHSPLQVPAATLDPRAVGYVQQMFADNQFFNSVAAQVASHSFRDSVGLLEIPQDYAAIKAQPPSSYRLPMSWDQPDYVFADEQDGVVAIKHDREILYVSLYWRAGYGINKLARVHYLTPGYQQVAVVREDEAQFEPSGRTYLRKDWINFGFANGGTNIPYPADIHQALAGEALPIAKDPSDVPFKPGDESYFGGKAQFYVLRFGNYLVAMNTTPDKTFEIEVPSPASEMVSNRANIPAGSSEKLAPSSTAVYNLTP